MILPDSVQAALTAIEAKLPADEVMRAAAITALPPQERALLDWFNQDIAEAENHQTYCNEGI